MGIIVGVCAIVGACVITKNVIVPVLEGTVQGIKDYRKELKEEKAKKIEPEETSKDAEA